MKWLILAVVVACGGKAAPSGPLSVRLCNTTDKDFVGVWFWDKDRDRGPLTAGTCTPYEIVPRAYNYTYVKFTIGADEFVIQPIDFIGAKELSAGRWSYNAKITDYDKRQAEAWAKPST